MHRATELVYLGQDVLSLELILYFVKTDGETSSYIDPPIVC